MQNRNFKKLTMSKKDFNRLSEFITFKFGIKLPENKKVLLESRLRKRVLELGFESYSQYTNHLFTDDGLQNEIVEMIDRVSTNKTDFFREEQHFYFLKENILPRFYKNTPNKKFKVWSAGCSSGEEAYTIAIVLEEFALENVGFDYEIMGTDISQSVLKKSAVAVYPEKRIDDISLSIKKKYFLRSKDRSKKNVKVIPYLRKKVRFFQLNLMEDNYSVFNEFDLIFCRNVLIYFDKKNQEKVVTKLAEHITSKGYLFIGHSESLVHFDSPFNCIQPTVYQLKK